MPTYIVKPNPDRDLYVEWSTVVENLTGVGTRAQIGGAEDRMARADETGSSAAGGMKGYRGWDDGQFLVTNTERRDAHFFWLLRADLEAYADAYAADDVEAAERLLKPIPDED